MSEEKDIERRLTAIETTLKHLVDALSDLRQEIRSTRYVTEEVCEKQHKLYSVEFDAFQKEYNMKIYNIGHDIELTHKEIETLRKDLNGAMHRFDESRKDTSSKVWDVIKPLLTLILGALLAFALGDQLKK